MGPISGSSEVKLWSQLPGVCGLQNVHQYGGGNQGKDEQYQQKKSEIQDGMLHAY